MMKINATLLLLPLIFLFGNFIMAQKGGGHGGGHGSHGGGHAAGHFSGVGHSAPTICAATTQLQGVDFHDEYIQFKDGDTLTTVGIFSAMVIKKNNAASIDEGILLQAKGKVLQSFISFSDVRYVRMQDFDSSLAIKGYIEFSSPDSTGTFWRKIAEGKATVYDNLFFTKEQPGKLGDQFKILTKDGAYLVYERSGLRSMKGEFKKFINHRYQEHFKKSDFKSVLDMVKYIAKQG